MSTLGSINSQTEVVSLTPEYPQLVVFSATGIDAKVSGARSLGTTDATKRFYPIVFVIRVASANTISLVPSISVGTNATSYNNIGGVIALTGLTSVNKMLKQELAVSAIDSVAPNTQIFANITIGATATTMTVDVHVIGYYL